MDSNIEFKKRLEKIIISGDVVEYIRFANPIPVEHRDYIINKCCDTSEGKRDDNLLRARSCIRRYIWCNVTPFTKFITLTYKDCNLDYEQLNYDFKQFIKKLRRYGYDCPYLWISEHQKERGLKEGNSGSLHIHCLLFNDKYIHYDIISNAWGRGYIDIHTLRDINNLGAYVCKYLTKEEFAEYHKHAYHISRGLKKPLELNRDGYNGNYCCFEHNEIFENVNFKYSNVSEYNIDMPDGTIFNNSILYQQGVIVRE